MIEEETVQLLKVKVKLIDDSSLFIYEIHTPDFNKYSYHWQNKKGAMLIRWDNKPHWKHLKTFPHHKHTKEGVLPSHRITIEEAIEIIRTIIKD